MADSTSHKFGQIVGWILENTVEPFLSEFALKHNLYLDKKGTRKSRGSKQKVSFTDTYGNQHDLDFVLEKNGSEDHVGRPFAFIEVAWRRYTKHSRNKAQEIQGAIIPLKEKYKNDNPFLGVILAGIYTEGALKQLKSLGFEIIYFEYETVIQAFKHVGIDVIYEENTTEKEFKDYISAWEKLPEEEKERASQKLTEINKDKINAFIKALEHKLDRQISFIRILPLYGKSFDLYSVETAINFIETYQEQNELSLNFTKYEVEIRYNNNDFIEAVFHQKSGVIEFLKKFI